VLGPESAEPITGLEGIATLGAALRRGRSAAGGRRAA
jgi:hypothetical protein